jgi:murein DD-endopeptidase MepM/ murein hydrolase activator NlpD
MSRLNPLFYAILLLTPVSPAIGEEFTEQSDMPELLDLTEQDNLSRNNLLDLLEKTGIDAEEHPELCRALGEGSPIPVEDQIRRRQEIINSIPSIMPVKPGFGYFSSSFGSRHSSFSTSKQFHKGIDIAGQEGTEIFAPADGIVRYASKYGRYGNYISIVHGYGLVSKFAHASQLLVKAGQYIHKGDKIALMGSTGRVTGTHLHYEIWLNDHVVDPLRFMLDRPNNLVAQTKEISNAESSP